MHVGADGPYLLLLHQRAQAGLRAPGAGGCRAVALRCASFDEHANVLNLAEDSHVFGNVGCWEGEGISDEYDV